MAAGNERLAAAEPGYYTWSFPGSPVRVQIALEVVRRIEAQMPPNGESHVESGLLLGTANGHTTVIADSQAIAKAGVPEMRRAVASAGKMPVGYYRIRRQGSLRLDSEEVSIAESLFREAHQVVLLIQPADSGPANASFFFRDRDALNSDFPFLEFPFDSELLAKAELHRLELAERKHERLMPAPVAAATPRRGGRRAWNIAAWALVALALIAAAGAGGRYLPQVLSRLRPRPPVTQRPAQPPAIGLEAVRENADLRLTWDRTAPAVANATSGVLSIQDGTTQRVVPLSAAQVHDGSVLYTPVNEQVQMWLTVSGPAATAVESIIAINPRQETSVAPAAVSPTAVSLRQQPQASPPARVVYLKPFSAPVKPGDNGRVAAAALDTPPALADPAVAAPIAFAAPVPAVPRPAPPPSQQPKPAAVAPQYYPASAILQVKPQFPTSLRPVVSRPTMVEVTVNIDIAGNVVSAEVTPAKGTHQLLINEALAAARQWKFRPARRGDQPVPSQMLLRFNFNPF
jgi:protein TonB